MIHWKWSNGEPCRKSIKNENKNINKNISQNIIDENINFVRESKRENIDLKLSNRAMICQIGLNPFLQNSTYGNDIQQYDSVMKK